MHERDRVTTPVPFFNLLDDLYERARYKRQERDLNHSLAVQKTGDKDVYRLISRTLRELIL